MVTLLACMSSLDKHKLSFDSPQKCAQGDPNDLAGLEPGQLFKFVQNGFVFVA
jgi:hypothetical protein